MLINQLKRSIEVLNAMLVNRNDSLNDVFNNVSHELHRGALDRKHPFRYVNLSTMGQEGINTRLIVLRRVEVNLDLIFFTDHRSQKVADLTANAHASLLCWHPGKKAQLIIKGTVTLHRQDTLSEKYWSGISIEGRKAYGSALAPGAQVDRPDLAHDWPDQITNEHFCVMVFHPQQLEVLQLHKLSHYRAKYQLAQHDWLGCWLVP